MKSKTKQEISHFHIYDKYISLRSKVFDGSYFKHSSKGNIKSRLQERSLPFFNEK